VNGAAPDLNPSGQHEGSSQTLDIREGRAISTGHRSPARRLLSLVLELVDILVAHRAERFRIVES
jgi:hypothetical protein